MDLCDSTYQQICSARTVQSDTKGFFYEFFHEVKQSCGEKWLKNYFAKFKSDQARILSIFSDREICDPVLGILENVKPVYKQKDALFSAQRRAQAEKYHLIEDLSKALTFANLAVMRAPARDVDINIDNGITLALAFWTRALILIDLGDGEAALNDLKLAAIGVESKQSVEYYLKIAKAYAYMGELARAEISLNIAEKLAHGTNKKINAYRQEIAMIKGTKMEDIVKQSVKLTHGENPELSGASNLIKVSEAPEKGHYIVAKDALKTGDIVLAEQPVAACLLPSHYGSHCHHCFLRLKTPLPCLKCSGIAFCSTKCMNDACSTYHRFECEFMDLLIGSGMSILCYIALRIFTQSNVKEGLHTANKLISDLISHKDSRSVDDFLQRSLMAGFLLRILQKSQYFGHRKTEGVNPTAKELQVGAALLGVLQVLQFNAHEIYETMITPEHRFEGSKIVYVGAGIYATGSYFNHECWPSVARYFVGKTIILACTRPHKINEMIAENYGPTFIKKNTKERQRALRARYLFTCECEACHKNWPTLQKLDKQARFRCTSPNCSKLLQFPKDLGKDVRCTQCRKNIDLTESVKKLIECKEIYRKAATAMQDQNTQMAIELFKEGIDMFFEIAALPHKDTIVAQESLRACLADTGTTFIK